MFDSDGRVDIISASQADDTVEWYRNNGRGNFSRRLITNGLDGVIGIFAADVDGDGDTDVVAGAQHEGRVVVLDNDGDQNFTEQIVYFDLGGISRPVSVFASDITGDGALDVLSANTGIDMIGLYPKQVDSPLSPPTVDDAIFHVADKSPNGTLVGVVSANDPDPIETLTYAIVAGNETGVFAINSNNGQLMVANQNQLDYESMPTIILHVAVTDFAGLTGSAIVTIHLIRSGDFNDDGNYDCVDVDMLVASIVAADHPSNLDMTGDNLVNTADLAQWLVNAGGANLPSGNPYLHGDANLDGTVNALDLNALALNWQQSVIGWCAGDFTADGIVNSQDLNQLALNWQADAAAAAARLPRAALAIQVDPITRGRMRLIHFVEDDRSEYTDAVVRNVDQRAAQVSRRKFTRWQRPLHAADQGGETGLPAHVVDEVLARQWSQDS